MKGLGGPRERSKSRHKVGGFTLVEVLAVLVLVGILSVSAAVYYANMLRESKKHGAMTLVATAQSQLSFEFARVAVAGLPLDSDVQAVCQNVIIDSPDVNASINCSGELSEYVSINAAIDDVNVGGAWVSPTNTGS